jgi:hypothetical protein
MSRVQQTFPLSAASVWKRRCSKKTGAKSTPGTNEMVNQLTSLGN